MSESGSQDGPRWPGFEALRREIDRVFEQVSGFPRGPAATLATVPIDMVETENGYELTAELPGIDPGQVELTLAGRALTLAGEQVDPRAGQKRRAAIARLLVSRRPVWLLDEPTAGLDKASDERFAGLMAAHLEGGGIIVAATHLPLGLDGAQELRMAAV